MIVAGRHVRTDPSQMRWVHYGSQHLRGPDIGAAKHSDLAVGVRQRCRPLHGVISVVRLVQERIPLPIRGVAAPNILDDDDIPTCRATYADV